MAQTPEGKVKTWLYGTKARPGVLFQFFPGAYVYKPPGGMYGRSGTADCLLCWRGIFVAIEIKAAPEDGGSEPTALQLKALKEVREAGGVSAVLKGRDLRKLGLIRDAVLAKLEEIRRESDSSVR